MMTAKVEAFRQSLSHKDREEIIQTAVVLFCEKEEALIHLTEFRNACSEMALQFQQMKDELQGACSEIKTLREQNQHLTGIKTLLSKGLFGRGTEKSEEILNQAINGGTARADHQYCLHKPKRSWLCAGIVDIQETPEPYPHTL